MKKNHQAFGQIKLRLSTKLIISIALLECLLMSAIVLVVEKRMRHSVMEEFLKRGRSVSRNLAAVNSTYVATYNYVKIEQNVERVKGESGLLYAVVSFFDGEVAAYSGDEAVREQVCSGGLNKRTLNIDKELIQYGTLGGENFCDIAVPIFLKEQKWGIVRVGFSLNGIREDILSMRKLLLGLGGIGMLFGCLTALLLARRITRPVHQLVESADLISQGNYDHPVRISTKDEIGYLGHRFAAMQQTMKEHILLLTSTNEKLEGEIETRKQKEKELIKAKKAADAANVAKSHFLANISHELRTPLNGVLGLTELLMGTADLSDRQRGLSEKILHSGKALIGIINEILDFSRIDAGKLELVQAMFNLPDLVEETVDVFAEGAVKKGVELTCLIHHDVPTGVIGDQVRLRQVLMNILGNALKFTDHGEVTACVQVMEQYERNVTLRFEVTDTGMGIKPDALMVIFDSFSQADASLTRQHGGTGLGLAIARDLTELMGGSIHVKSKPGEGSTFWFTVPFERRTATKADVRQPFPEDLKVLIADDNATNRSLVQYHLTRWGIGSLEAENGSQTQTILQQDSLHGSIGIVLLGMMMSDMNGMAVAQAIKSNPATSQVKTVLMAPLDLSDADKESRLQYVDVLITKPVHRSRLYEVLSSLTTDLPDQKHVTMEQSNLVIESEQKPRPHILLVEDNPINMMVAREMLEEFGCKADVAVNGREAIEYYQTRHYDIIAMDCQMPEMDGYEATRRIREIEKSRQPQAGHIPIIGVTAHAMEGDRKKCLAAGMNDYLSKPFTTEQLEEIVERWSPEFEQHGDLSAQPVELSTLSPMPEHFKEGNECIDQNTLGALRNLQKGRGSNLLSQLIGVFFQDSPKQVEILRGAVSQGDTITIQRTAHRLKSSCGNLGATKLAELCKEIEMSAYGGATENSTTLFSKIEVEYQTVREALSSELEKGV